MGRAEYAGLGSLATGLGRGIQAEMEQRQRDKYAKRQDWLRCIMSAEGTPESCAQIVGYQPDPQEAEGAVQFQSEAEARKRAGEERTAIGKLKPEEYKTAHTRTIPGQDLTMRSRLPTGEMGSTVMGETKEKEIYLPDLGPRPDWRGALAGAGEKRRIAKERGVLSKKLATEERGVARDIRKEQRTIVTAKAKERRSAAERREFALWKQKQGIGGEEPKGPVDTKFILREASKATFAGRLYDTPRKIDKLVRMWGMHNELAGVDDMAMENALASLGLPTMADRGGLKEDLKSQPTDKEREKVLAEMGYDEKTVRWIMENYSRWSYSRW